MAESKESRHTSSLGLIGVHRESVVVAAARMRHVIRAPSDGALRLHIHYIEDERSVYGNSGMQATRRFPRPIPHAAHVIAMRSRRLQWKPAPIARYHRSLIDETPHADLNALQRRIHIAGCPSRPRLLTEDVPRLDRLPQLH